MLLYNLNFTNLSHFAADLLSFIKNSSDLQFSNTRPVTTRSDIKMIEAFEMWLWRMMEN